MADVNSKLRRDITSMTDADPLSSLARSETPAVVGYLASFASGPGGKPQAARRSRGSDMSALSDRLSVFESSLKATKFGYRKLATRDSLPKMHGCNSGTRDIRPQRRPIAALTRGIVARSLRDRKQPKSHTLAGWLARQDSNLKMQGLHLAAAETFSLDFHRKGSTVAAQNQTE
jgi:hypothetical protein